MLPLRLPLKLELNMQKDPFSKNDLIFKIEQFLAFYEHQKGCSVHTLKAYKKDLSQAFDSIPNDGQEKEFQLWLKEASLPWNSLALSSRNRKIGTLKSFCNWLYEFNYTEKNYALNIFAPKVPKRLPHYLTVDEVLSVLNIIKINLKKSGPNQEHLLFLLLYGSGLRISEATNLTWKQIKLHERKMRILGKGQKERDLIIPLLIQEYLIQFQQQAESTFIWGKNPLNPRIGYDWIKSLGIQAGLTKPIHPHLLRHSFATHLLTSGANLRVLQKLLGHESLTATEKYTHLNLDALARTLDRFHPLGEESQNRILK